MCSQLGLCRLVSCADYLYARLSAVGLERREDRLYVTGTGQRCSMLMHRQLAHESVTAFPTLQWTPVGIPAGSDHALSVQVSVHTRSDTFLELALPLLEQPEEFSSNSTRLVLANNLWAVAKSFVRL